MQTDKNNTQVTKKEIFVCETCGSKNVQGKAWVGLNDNSIDNSLQESGEDEDFWCNDCQAHTTVKMKFVKAKPSLSESEPYRNNYSKLVEEKRKLFEALLELHNMVQGANIEKTQRMYNALNVAQQVLIKEEGNNSLLVNNAKNL